MYRKHRRRPTTLKTNWTLYIQSFSQLKTISLLSHVHVSIITWMSLVWTLPYFSILLVGLRSWIPNRRKTSDRAHQLQEFGSKDGKGKRNNKRGCLQHRETHRFTVCKAKVWLLIQQTVSRWETNTVILPFLCCFWFYIRPNFLSKHPNCLVYVWGLQVSHPSSINTSSSAGQYMWFTHLTAEIVFPPVFDRRKGQSHVTTNKMWVWWE